MRLVEVRWLDSTSHCDQPWYSEAELRKGLGPLTCWTAGYLFSEDTEQITVVLSHGGEDGELGMAITIPKVSVLEVRDLQIVHTPLAA